MNTKQYLKGSGLTIDPNEEVRAISRYIRMSPFKVRRVLDQIRGRQYREALIILEFMPYKACEPILKTLRSAVANAEHNNGLEPATLVVSKAFADGGPILKRYRPRAQGRAYQIRKPTCHITICVAPEINREFFPRVKVDENKKKSQQKKHESKTAEIIQPDQDNLPETYSLPVLEIDLSKDFMNKIDPYVLYKLGLNEEEQTTNYPRQKEFKQNRDVVKLAMTVRVKDPNKKLEASKIEGFEETFQRGKIIGCIGDRAVVIALQNDSNVHSVEASRPGTGFDNIFIAS